jgi:hypothetical protein
MLSLRPGIAAHGFNKDLQVLLRKVGSIRTDQTSRKEEEVGHGKFRMATCICRSWSSFRDSMGLKKARRMTWPMEKVVNAKRMENANAAVQTLIGLLKN